jgi:hypothetical protein
MTLLELAGVGFILTPVVLYVSELLMALAWSRVAFESGWTAVDLAEAWLPAKIPPVGRTISTRSGKLRFVESRLCLFRSRFLPFHLQTPFQLRGTMALGGAGVRLHGRLPVMPVAGLLAFVVVWSVFAVVGAFHGVGRQGATFVIPFVALAALMCYGSVWLERQRLLAVYGEIKEWLGPA